MRPEFNFGSIVIVETNLVGVVVKSWFQVRGYEGQAATRSHNYDIYIRSFNGIKNYQEDEMTKFVYDKELSDESLKYYE